MQTAFWLKVAYFVSLAIGVGFLWFLEKEKD